MIDIIQMIDITLHTAHCQRDDVAAALVAVPTLYLAARAAWRGDALVSAAVSASGFMAATWLGCDNDGWNMESMLELDVVLGIAVVGGRAIAIGLGPRTTRISLATAREQLVRSAGLAAGALSALAIGWCAGESVAGWRRFDGLESAVGMPTLLCAVVLMARGRYVAAIPVAVVALIGVGMTSLLFGPVAFQRGCSFHGAGELALAFAAIEIAAVVLVAGLLTVLAARWALLHTRRRAPRVRPRTGSPSHGEHFTISTRETHRRTSHLR